MLDITDYFHQRVRDAFREFCAQRPNPEGYRDLLFQTHYYVCESVPVMRAVLAVCPDHALAPDLARHTKEEVGHDKLVLNDLARLGGPYDTTVSPVLEEFVGFESQIPTGPDPMSCLHGVMLVMEGYAPSHEDVQRLAKHFGVEMSAASAFIAHAEADPEHGAAVRQRLQHPSIDSDLALDCAVTTCRLLRKHWNWMATRSTAPAFA